MRRMMTTWVNDGDQAAYDLGLELISEIRMDRSDLEQQEEAIKSLGSLLQSQGDIVPAPEPGTIGTIHEIGAALDEIGASERPRLITEAAIRVWRGQQTQWGGAEENLVKAQDILDNLRDAGLHLGVEQPLAVIGTVLTSAVGFTKIARSTFEFTPVEDA